MNRFEHEPDCDVGWCVCPDGQGRDLCACGAERMEHVARGTSGWYICARIGVL